MDAAAERVAPSLSPFSTSAARASIIHFIWIWRAWACMGRSKRRICGVETPMTFSDSTPLDVTSHDVLMVTHCSPALTVDSGYAL